VPQRASFNAVSTGFTCAVAWPRLRLEAELEMEAARASIEYQKARLRHRDDGTTWCMMVGTDDAEAGTPHSRHGHSRRHGSC
jgi:hypothetical protein